MRLLLRFPLTLTTLLIFCFISAPATLLAAPSQALRPPLFETQGRVINEPFLSYIQQHGGLEHFGDPLTDELIDAELGIPVQYFTYARLERHGAQIQLTALGRLRAHGREQEAPFLWRAPVEALPEGRSYFAASGHTLDGAFAWYHAQHGGVELLGYPISEEFYESRPDGQSVLVQYFERARLAYQVGVDGNGEVQREPLGLWMAQIIFPASAFGPGRPLLPLAEVSLNYPAGSNSGHNIELAAARLNGQIIEPGANFSFLTALGEVSARSGYRPGAAIVNGVVVDNEPGGGICTVATLLYRASWYAGLPVPERVGHRYLLAAFADTPGLDAAVYTPGQDLRIRNDTGERLYLVSHTQGGIVSLILWGRGDGRRVEVARPDVTRGAVITAINRRTLQLPGYDARQEQVLTTYQPLPATAPPAEKPPTPPAKGTGR